MMLYRANETMKMLGEQSTYGILTGEGIARLDFDNMIAAHRANGTHSLYELGVDAFALGYIYGKRVERNKKKRQSFNFGE